MVLDAHGFYRPELGAGADRDDLDAACPLLVPDLDEDALADRFLPETPQRDHKIGKYDRVFAAHAEEGTFRRDGSSGGLGSWMATELLRKGMIDGVIHARPVPRDGAEDPFFRYGISRSVEEVTQAAHSHYHVVEISEVLEEVKCIPGRYLFIGIPCMVKAVRRAQALDPDLSDRILFTMGLVCGHLKSVHWALSLGWAAGIAPKDIDSITFRVKSENVPAKAYYFGLHKRGAPAPEVHDSAPLTGGKFNLGAMMPDACNYCDDVVAETADLTIGDAWLPRYSFDWRGKNMVISRHPELTALVQAASEEGRVIIEPMTAKEAADAQAGGFRQRREGLAHRLARRAARGHWVPKKRDLPDMTLPGLLRARIYNRREEIAQQSRGAFRKALDEGSITLYDREMAPIFKNLRRLELLAASTRIISVRLRALFSRRRS
ncbi:Coenzyme F420-reducing hydrogenase, beta subunit [Salipiger marinus]|uniref:Coenzyme F420-reducing hydrogenase, beta subunit n=2 Tax=Salipiger marinus TaxID=555512 RepID=A0A1G8QL88_9RHOB|nr:Coenzyme F420-reducing hydrogenase, beta subunit [Salipiger marinus]